MSTEVYGDEADDVGSQTYNGGVGSYAYHGDVNGLALHLPLIEDLRVVAGSGSVTFTRASTATYLGLDGLIHSAAIDEPRFEANGLLIEGASENLCLRSEEMDNASWVKSNAIVTANDAVAPDGATTADLVTLSTNLGYVYQTITVSSSTDYTFSWYAADDSLSGTPEYAIYDVTNAAWIVASTSFTPASSSQRFSVSFTTPATCTSIRVYPLRGAGAATGGAHIWGCQCEALPFASSYIPTQGSTVTRSADICRLQADGNHPPIDAGSPYSVSLSADIIGSNSENQVIYSLGFGEIGVNDFSLMRIIANGGDTIFNRSAGSLSFGTPTVGTTYNYAATISSDELLSIYTNGSLAASDTKVLSDDTGVFAQNISIGCLATGSTSKILFGHVKSLKIFNKALSADEVAEL